MKRLLALIFAFASLTAAAQYVPGQKNYGNYNVYGSQWINGDLKLQKCVRSKSDTLIIFTTAAGVIDTINMSDLRNSLGTPITDTSLWAANAALLQGKDTADIWTYVQEHASSGGGESYFDSTAAGMIYLKNPANKLIIGATTSTGTEKLNVYNGSVLFDGTTGATPASGAGTRLMWIPAKGAFRAGTVTGTQFNDANIGYYSNAFGYNCTANGGWSFAANSGCIASGAISFACNGSTIANGSNSFAANQSSTANGNGSFAINGATTANAEFSFSAGLFTTSQSYLSATFGRYNVIQGTTGSWVSTDHIFAIGNGASSGITNNALTILKNGTAYIGDASSTTDPILTVSTTDSTTTLIGILKLTPQDDPPVSASEGMIYADTDHHLYYYNGTAWVQLD